MEHKITMREIRRLVAEQARALGQDEKEVEEDLIEVLLERGWEII